MNRLAQRKPLAVGGIFAALAVIVLVALVMPKVSAVKDRQTQLDKATQQGDALQVEVDALEQAKHDAPAVKKQIEALESAVPATAELPTLIREVRRAADRAAVDFMQISPGTPSPSQAGAFSTIPAQISTNGSYFALTEFLYRLETLRRAVKVTNLTVGPGPDGLPQLSLQLTAEVYTSDTSAGPGSLPGPTTGSTTGGA